MNSKRVAGLALIIIGVVILGFCGYAKHRINEVKGAAEGLGGWVPESFVKDTATHEFDKKMMKYEGLVKTGLYIGSVVLLAGVVVTWVFRNRRS